jgi:hypothetical protein
MFYCILLLGAVIGKKGDAIAKIQKETGAKVKMSKNNDFYPGERFSCLSVEYS